MVASSLDQADKATGKGMSTRQVHLGNLTREFAFFYLRAALCSLLIQVVLRLAHTPSAYTPAQKHTQISHALFPPVYCPTPPPSGDRVLQGLLAEVLAAHKDAGGKLLPPVGSTTGNGDNSNASNEAAAAAVVAQQQEESMSMSDAMSEAGWMGSQDSGG
jgi:hypothetical protein